ncbi:chemotaxis protein CheA [Candidatus Woesearchaeota archaeon]|nr:chemotaxis protein CheA [Candidatus Woesearchaeota archaeon]
MAVDITQFHKIFFEESFEGLQIMESGLLDMEPGTPDNEQINAIFRAAHSIKGGAGSFGFAPVSAFTHHLETLLDEIRSGHRTVQPTDIDVLLQSVDCLGQMLRACEADHAIDQEQVHRHQQALEALLNGVAADVQDTLPSPPLPAATPDSVTDGWQIVFTPHRDIFASGNDPLRIIRELDELGTLTIEADTGFLPALQDYNPEECFLSWNLTLEGTVNRSEIEEVFAWVEDDCDMAIRPLSEVRHAQDQSLLPTAPPLTVTESILASPAPDAAPSPITQTTSRSRAETDIKAGTGSPTSIRVDTQKIDQLINLVGELVITQSMLGMLGESFAMDRLEQLQSGLVQLERHTRDLQESVMNIRMLPISFVFNRFPRMVFDLSTKLGKRVELKVSGEQTELDKTVIEQVADPLAHLIRNSLDHGIESPDQRRAAGKSETGQITLNAYHRGGSIVIEVSDDGRGLDSKAILDRAVARGLIESGESLTPQQTHELIFAPGFSTAEQVSDVSGRGVGMDVVRKNIESLGGNIIIHTAEGKGSTFSIHLPLTLAILDGQTIAVGDETYIVPLVSIIESIRLSPEQINRLAGKGETLHLRDEYLPIIRLHEIFDIRSVRSTQLTSGLVVVVEGLGGRCGLFVDNILGQQQVVIKSLEENYRKVPGISGATILGDGSVALILDIPGLMHLSRQQSRESSINHP